MYAGCGSPAIRNTLAPPEKPRHHRRRHQKKVSPYPVGQTESTKEGRVEFLKPRVSGQSSFMKKQSEAILIVERSAGASTDREIHRAVLSELIITGQRTVLEDSSGRYHLFRWVNDLRSAPRQETAGLDSSVRS